MAFVATRPTVREQPLCVSAVMQLPPWAAMSAWGWGLNPGQPDLPPTELASLVRTCRVAGEVAMAVRTCTRLQALASSIWS